MNGVYVKTRMRRAATRFLARFNRVFLTPHGIARPFSDFRYPLAGRRCYLRTESRAQCHHRKNHGRYGSTPAYSCSAAIIAAPGSTRTDSFDNPRGPNVTTMRRARPEHGNRRCMWTISYSEPYSGRYVQATFYGRANANRTILCGARNEYVVWLCGRYCERHGGTW